MPNKEAAKNTFEDAAPLERVSCGGKDRAAAAKDAFALGGTRKARIALWVGVAVLVVASLCMGKYDVSPSELLDALVSYPAKVASYVSACMADPSLWTEGSIPVSNAERVLWHIRMPRVAIVVLTGAALSIAGASYQGMFKNPLTSPDLLGASAGASLGACLALLWNLGGGYVQLFAFLGGLAAVGATVWLDKQVGSYDPMLGLVLAGILVGTLFQSGMSVVKLVADSNDQLPAITFWLMGSFNDINRSDLIAAVPMVLGFVILLRHAWQLNVLSFGDEEAKSLGVNTGRVRLWVIFGATMVTSASVAVAGIVGWVGLVVPHLARSIVGPNYRILLPTSMLAGAAFLLVVDDLARLLLAVEIPIGILTALVGVPFFVIIFKRNMRGW